MSGAEPATADIVDRILDIFACHGADAYLGESVTMAQHMLQTATLAQASGAPDLLVVAALLHDIGHFTGALGPYAPDDDADRHHEAAGATALAGHFPPRVIEAVRLHVAAKRYLCAVEEPYHDGLSNASRHTLALQGGPMTASEIAAFRQRPFHEDAVQLRRWDDGGKVRGMRTPTLAAFRPLLLRVALAG